jgi:hypothetical protein
MEQAILFYIAGYIDGDGCLYIGKHVNSGKSFNTYEYSIQICCTDNAAMNYIQSIFGGKIRSKPVRGNRKPVWAYTIKNTEAYKLAELLNGRFVLKNNECNLFLRFIESIKHNSFKQVCQDTINFRNNIINTIRKERTMHDLISRNQFEDLKHTDIIINPCEADYAYLAGLIDAEGCFRVTRYKPKNKPNHVYCIKLDIGNTKFSIFPWLVHRFGGTIAYRDKVGNRKSMIIWSLSSRSLYNVLDKIIPYIRVKKAVAEKIKEFYETTIPNGGDRHSEKFKESYSNLVAVRENIVNEIHNLNFRGKRKSSSLGLS